MSNPSLFQQVWGNQQPTLSSLYLPIPLFIYRVYADMCAVVMVRDDVSKGKLLRYRLFGLRLSKLSLVFVMHSGSCHETVAEQVWNPDVLPSRDILSATQHSLLSWTAVLYGKAAFPLLGMALLRWAFEMLVNSPSEHLSLSDMIIPSMYMRGDICARLKDCPWSPKWFVWIQSLPWILEQPFLVAQRTKSYANQGAVFWLQPIWTLITRKQFSYITYSSTCFLSWLLSHCYMRPVQFEWFAST